MRVCGTSFLGAAEIRANFPIMQQGTQSPFKSTRTPRAYSKESIITI